MRDGDWRIDNTHLLSLKRAHHWSKGYDPSPAEASVILPFYIPSAAVSTSKHPRPLLTEQKSNYCEYEQPQNTKADSSENADGIGCGGVNMRGSEEEGG